MAAANACRAAIAAKVGGGDPAPGAPKIAVAVVKSKSFNGSFSSTKRPNCRALASQTATKIEGAGEPAAALELDSLRDTILSRSDLSETSRRAKTPFNVVIVSSEAAPYSKTGGLGDVCGSLPVSLARRGHRVMVITPRYLSAATQHLYKAAVDAQCRIKVGCFGAEHEVAFFHEYRAGVDWVFVDHPSYHRLGTPYGDTRGTFGDNQFRFTLLCHAACEAPLVLPLGGCVYGDKCLFIANDWHAGLVPVLISSKYRRNNVYKDSRCVLAIHNLAHQGVEPSTTYGNLGLPPDWYGALEWVFPNWARAHALDKGEAVNHLKGGIVTADRILTVSQGYAWEMTTAEGGFGLDGLLRSRNSVINGITNGIDVDDWNPATDRNIASQYTLDDFSGKAQCKAAIQKELGLAVRPDVPLIGFIGRLDYQKGPDLIQEALPELLSDDVQMIMLGSGEPSIESWMVWAEVNYKEKFRGWVGFNVPVAHRITAGCDILLMPSRFEPCGLNQLYAMRYGTIPVVHSTGGLRDTVEGFNPFANGGLGAGTGWTFSPLSKDAMIGALFTAISTYRNHKESWNGIIKRGMSQDFSWDRAALQYEQVFEWTMMDPPYA
ncbi:starch synthase 1, chloroplastic/amyloplastic [Selaginella moellendorffii]|uniref:starch synthase 1, chloroplastic/amyloplastic n=1 Tax=Selaginella moellendorffii TaxID=88036 RepID=UPI000D1C60F5|nr:starch synthase 1, chloroplastic/amyloplastic [Selaginella moellendorffii]|eukprot:XP_024524899.1 starch synthase 1, chloroplastic/amyloplastic [Selaginella moellendorffii]